MTNRNENLHTQEAKKCQAINNFAFLSHIRHKKVFFWLIDGAISKL